MLISGKAKIKDWKKEIRILMKDFCFSDDEILNTISYVTKKVKDDTSQNECYEMAWQRMMSIM